MLLTATLRVLALTAALALCMGGVAYGDEAAEGSESTPVETAPPADDATATDQASEPTEAEADAPTDEE